MKILLLVSLSPIALLVLHSLMVRLMARIKPKLSNQAVILVAMLVFNCPVLGIALSMVGADPTTLIYVFITVNSFAYCYFHLFNMTETARRIKILTGIYTSRVKQLSDLAAYYSTEKALELRLERLENLSQIKRLENGNYVLASRLIYFVSVLVVSFRTMLGFQDS